MNDVQKYTFEFNSMNKYWDHDMDTNIRYLYESCEKHINCLGLAKGYIYMNEIYEIVGIEWDPNNENVCIIYPDVDYVPRLVEFEIFYDPKNEESIFVHILINTVE